MDWVWFQGLVRFAAHAIEALGVLVIVIGVLVALASYLARFSALRSEESYDTLRRGLGRSIIVGLEILIAGDIMRTVVVEQSVQNIGFLGVVVLIRTLLSFSLFVEIEGRWPWQARERSPRGRPV